MLLGEGRGFEIAQSRLGPGRIHHCMRFIGLAERAIEAMCRRAQVATRLRRRARGDGRRAPGDRPVALRHRTGAARHPERRLEHGPSRRQGGAQRHRDRQDRRARRRSASILDRAIQIHGGAGLSQDFFLAEAFAETRFLRIGDGPDEVHREALAKAELAEIRMTRKGTCA